MSVPAGPVMTIGETMALFEVPYPGTGDDGVRMGFGGAESNVAIGLARLGVPVTWCSRVSDDAVGMRIVRELRADGVGVRTVLDQDAPTGLMIKELRRGRPYRVRYYRAGSATSRLTPADVDGFAGEIAAAAVLHLTGITAAISATARAAVVRAVEVATDAGVPVSLDVNHRRTLWSDEDAAQTLGVLLPQVAVLFAGAEEARMLVGELVHSQAGFDDGERLGKLLTERGVGEAVIKLGALGSISIGDETFQVPTKPVEVVDPVGAGDAFVAGYLAEYIGGQSPQTRLQTGNACGGFVCTVPGDWEGLPSRAELQAAHDQEVAR